MRSKWYQSLRMKMLGAFAASLAMAYATILVMLAVAYLFIDVPVVGDLLRLLRATVGEVPVAAVTGFGLFLLFFFLLSEGTIRYIQRLDRALHEIARGKLDLTVPAQSDDELGHLARNLNLMTAQLKTSIEEERRAERAKYELVTSISHDLRTPLTSLVGYLDLIEKDKYRDEVELRHYTEVAYNKAKQLQRLIDQLFEFTRTSHGGMQVKPVPVNLRELLEQLAEEFVPQLEAAGMAYRLRLSSEKVMLTVDPDLMVRVLENLVSNAIRYGSEGRQVDIELEQADGEAVVRVANYGTPIPERELPYVFETFYRVEKSRSGATGGTGLGLAIARNIVTLHGGAIRAYNEPGRTVFEVRLPRR